MGNIWIYLLVMGGVTYLIRALPLVLLRREITNRTLRSFLYYVPYVTLSVMVFPAIIRSTLSPYAGLIALAVAVLLAWKRCPLIIVALAACIAVFLSELIFVPFT